MGAAFNNGVLRGSEKEAGRELIRRMESCREENGNSYSGGIGMADGAKRIKKHFESIDEAVDYLEEKAEKWGPALVVTTTVDGETVFVYGAWCSE